MHNTCSLTGNNDSHKQHPNPIQASTSSIPKFSMVFFSESLVKIPSETPMNISTYKVESSSPQLPKEPHK
jgi:hypothetical protein